MNDEIEVDALDPEQLAELQEALAGTYEVERELGQGGMATVYLARDLKHDRYVAIKVILPDLAQSLGAERFLREVQITAKLQHPHILPLYDSGEANGKLYYVMPFVEGESLGDRIERDQQLPIKEAVMICKEVAEALGYAHSMGLVHRDIKPDNIMLTGGHAVVADFGIARAMDAAGGEKITQTGMAVGTPAYMSPEQASGEGVDGRSDLYSLGCVLYEMLIGQVPFTGPTPMAIMARHTMDNVPPPTIMRDAIPDELEDVVMMSMAKTPADRYQTGMEMAEALDMVDVHTAIHRRPSTAMRQSGMMARQSGRGAAMTSGQYAEAIARPRWVLPLGIVGGLALVVAAAALIVMMTTGGGGPSPVGLGERGLDPRTVAVLYFEDLSSDNSLGYVADGLTEGLIDQLSRVRGLDVISENGVAQFRDSELLRDSIARILSAGTLVLGTVDHESGGRIRVSTRLLDGTSASELGRESFVVPEAEILAATDSVASDVSNTLRGWLGDEVELRERRAGTDNVTAWAALQRAERARKEAEEARNRGEAQIAIRQLTAADSMLQLAESADDDWMAPVIARGWVAYDLSLTEEGTDAAQHARDGLAHAARALAQDQQSAEAYELRGTLHWRLYNLRVTRDEDEWNQLLFDAREDLERAIDLDPTLASAYGTLSFVLYQPQIDEIPGALLAARSGLQEDAFLESAPLLISRAFWATLDLEQLSEARRWCEQGAQQYADRWEFVRCQLWLQVTPAVDADPAQAMTLVERLDDMLPDASWAEYLRAESRMLYGGTLGRAGMADSARSVLDQVRRDVTYEIDPEQELAGYIAYMYTTFDDFDTAIDLLKQYVAANPHHNFAEAAGTVWWWREIRNHPRWSEIEAITR